MDKGGGHMQGDPMVAVSTALRRARTAAGLSLDALGDLIGESAATLSRWERAERDVKIEYVVRIEEALGLPRGFIWRQAGLCEPCDDVESAIRNDGALSGPARAALVDVYRTLLRSLPSSADEGQAVPAAGVTKKARQRSATERRARRR